MLIVVQHFGRHCNCHFRGGCVKVGRSWKPYIEKAVFDELDLLVLTGGEEKRAYNQWERITWLRKRYVKGAMKNNGRAAAKGKYGSEVKDHLFLGSGGGAEKQFLIVRRFPEKARSSF
jgi:hypothetical protein